MQESESITFDRIPRPIPLLPPWAIVLAVVLFAALIYFVVWRSRRRSKEQKSLNLGER